jgi:hypothetical protein
LETPARRFERFLFCWFLFGLILFSLASHQRGDLLWPIMPAGALLAGRELDRLSRRAARIFDVAIATVVVVMMGGFVYYYFGPHARSSIVRQTVWLKDVVASLERYGGSEFPLTHLDSPMGLQIYLNTWRPRVTAERAAALLRGPDPAFIAVNDFKKLEGVRKPEDPPIYTVVPSPDSKSHPLLRQERYGGQAVRIVSNRQELELTNSSAFGFGDLTIRASGARLVDASEKEFVFEKERGGSAEIMIVNEGSEPRPVRLRILGEGPPHHRQERILTGHEIWRTKFFGK